MRRVFGLTVCLLGLILGGKSVAQDVGSPLPELPIGTALETADVPEQPSLQLIKVDPTIGPDCLPQPYQIVDSLEADPQFDEIDMSWLDSVRVGYDKGFVIASRREQDIGTPEYPFWIRFNGWGQLRHTYLDSQGDNRNLNQFQLKRGRLIFSTAAFNSNFRTYVQLDGRSSDGDEIRMLDYYLTWDLGHARWGLERGTIELLTGQYKMPFTLSRALSARDFEFADRSMASTFFDVNRSFGWGIRGQFLRSRLPIFWETALFNGLITGGAETGSSGTLDDNFAASARASCYPIGEWGNGPLADFECHNRPALRAGCGFAWSEIERIGFTEFSRVRVVDSGQQLSNVISNDVSQYTVGLFAVDASAKYRGWSTTLEYYFRSIGNFQGDDIADLFDHGFWFQLGKFVVPNTLQLTGRWSRVQGNSGTLGGDQQASEEIAIGYSWYFRGNNAKMVSDLTYLNGAPIDSPSLDITRGETGWLYRTQFQFSF